MVRRSKKKLTCFLFLKSTSSLCQGCGFVRLSYPLSATLRHIHMWQWSKIFPARQISYSASVQTPPPLPIMRSSPPLCPTIHSLWSQVQCVCFPERFLCCMNSCRHFGLSFSHRIGIKQEPGGHFTLPNFISFHRSWIWRGWRLCRLFGLLWRHWDCSNLRDQWRSIPDWYYNWIGCKMRRIGDKCCTRVICGSDVFSCTELIRVLGTHSRDRQVATKIEIFSCSHIVVGVRVIVCIASSFSQPIFDSAIANNFTGYPYIWYISRFAVVGACCDFFPVPAWNDTRLVLMNGTQAISNPFVVNTTLGQLAYQLVANLSKFGVGTFSLLTYTLSPWVVLTHDFRDLVPSIWCDGCSWKCTEPLDPAIEIETWKESNRIWH